MTAPTPEQMRALAAAVANLTVDNDWDATVIADVMTALRAAADQLEAAQKWLDAADTLAWGDSPYVPDLQDIIDGDHGRDCAAGTMMNVEEFYPCSCWKADL